MDAHDLKSSENHIEFFFLMKMLKLKPCITSNTTECQHLNSAERERNRDDGSALTAYFRVTSPIHPPKGVVGRLNLLQAKECVHGIVESTGWDVRARTPFIDQIQILLLSVSIKPSGLVCNDLEQLWEL